MEVFIEADKDLFQQKTKSYSKYFAPFVDHMKIIVEKHSDVSEYRIFNDYINIVQWPIRKLEYSYVLDQIVGKFDNNVKILDAGCGVTPVPFLLGTLSENVYAIDFSSNDIELMQSIKEKKDFPGSNNVRFDIQNICKLTFDDNYFDCISCVSVLEHIDFPYYMQALSEMYRVLKPGGTFVCTMDFWMGASRTATITSGGFTKTDIRQITNIFDDQVNQNGIEKLENLQREDIDGFWSAHYDAELDFSIREYIAVGFTVTKHIDPLIVENTLRKLFQYQKDQAYFALLERNNTISLIEKDREDRLQIIYRITKEIEQLQNDHKDRLEIINRQNSDLIEFSNKVDLIENDREDRLQIINRITKEIEQLQNDHKNSLEIINRQNNDLIEFSNKVDLIENDRAKRLFVIEQQQLEIKSMEQHIINYETKLSKLYSNPIIKLLKGLKII